MKKVLLFGGTGGIGRGLTEILKNDFECISVGSTQCDVSNENDVKKFLSNTEYDVIIYLSVKNINGELHKQTNDNIKSQLDVNVLGFLNVLRYSTDYLRTKGYGRIIYISSILSEKPIKGAGIYSATKSFCDNIIKTYSIENSKYGITSNSIQLGYFNDGLTNKINENIKNKVLNNIPLKRFGIVDEICPIIKSIINVEYINGSIISITGGL